MNTFAMTVLGPVEPGALGMTLMHEHLQMDITAMLATYGYPVDEAVPFTLREAAEARWNPGRYPDNLRMTDVALVVDDLRDFVASGGGTVVDMTPPDLGRNPAALVAIAEATGLNVVMGCGYYLAATHTPSIAGLSGSALADRLVAEITTGVGPQAVRPGIIGEVGTSDPLHPAEEPVIEAVAIAQQQTGLAVSVHLHPWGYEGVHVLERLVTAGASADRVVLGHLNTAHADKGYLGELLARDAVLEFDLFGWDHSLIGLGRYPPSDVDVAETVGRLVGEGHVQNILLSQDIGVRTRLKSYGGWGFNHLLEHVVPLLRERGLTDADLTTILVDNPRRLLTIEYERESDD